MPRVSRTAAQRYASAARKKARDRGERHAPILPPVTGQPAVSLPGGLAAPQPLEFAADEAMLREEQHAAPPPARVVRPASRTTRTVSRAELRHAARRAGSPPIVDYSYVRGDLRRIGIVFSVLVLVLVALVFVPGLQ